jgi:hypothetical protein
MQDKQALQESVTRPGLMTSVLETIEDQDLFWFMVLPAFFWPVFMYYKFQVCRKKKKQQPIPSVSES